MTGSLLSPGRRTAIVLVYTIAASVPQAWAEVGFEYLYDVSRDETPAVTLLAGKDGVIQPVFVPEGMTQLTGVRLKVQRLGQPGNLVVQVVRESGRQALGAGQVSPDAISGLFEFWAGPDFAAVAVTPGERLLIEARAEGSTRGDQQACYRLFGARPASYFGTPVNTYGTEQLWAGLKPIFDDRTCLAFQLLMPGRAAATEESFAFARTIAADPRDEWTLQRDPARKAQPDEVEVTASWAILPAIAKDPTTLLAVEDLPIFLYRVMGLQLNRTAAKDAPIIRLAIDPSLDGDDPRDEVHRIDVTDNAVTITGKTPRGLLRSVFHVEDMMRLAGAPVLKKGTLTRRPRYSPRITCTSFLIITELLDTESAYTDGHLSRITRSGFDAIWMYCNLCEVAWRSQIIPELATAEAARRVQHMRDLATRAGKYGIDLVLYCTTYTPNLTGQPRLGLEGLEGLPPAFYETHPDLKGVGQYRSMCTGVPKTRQFYAETTRNLLEAVPGIRALTLIVTGEGFGHCYMNPQGTCPRCHQRTEADVIAEAVQSVLDGAGDKAAVVVWPYAGLPRTGDLFKSLPRNACIMPDISKGGIVEIEGIRTPAYDYSISLEGPTPLYREHVQQARDARLGLWTRAEHAISLELVHVSHIPCYPRWVRRWEALHDVEGLSAVWANWMHYGFTPSPAAEIFGWYSFTPGPDGGVLLRAIARRDFGEPAVEHVLSAWRHFDEAIGQFPFSPQAVIAPGPIQQGPAHPLWLDPNFEVPVRHRAATNSLGWTQPWGPDLCRRRLTAVRDHWRAGMADLDKALAVIPAESRTTAALREASISWALGVTFEAVCNLLDWQITRKKFRAATTPEEKSKLLDKLEAIARVDLENARTGLTLARLDSRYGYANYGRGEQSGLGRGGTFSAVGIARKIAQLEHLLNVEFPDLRRQTAAREGKSSSRATE